MNCDHSAAYLKDGLPRCALCDLRDAENRCAAMDGLLDGIELIAVNDKTGCRSCTAIIQAIISERPLTHRPVNTGGNDK